MQTVLVPTFDEFNNYRFAKTVAVKIKNKPDFQDRKSITKLLPGLCCGAVGLEPLKELMHTGKMDVRSFYDTRQNTRKLKGYYISFLN